MVNLEALQVECASCFATRGEMCSTRSSGRTVSHHSARLRLARAPVACPRCGAAEAKPCLDPDGKAQTRLHAARNDAAWRAGRKGR